jgi:nitric oxide reductase activation protein
MMEAFESLNDEYGIFGFSGHGRENVDFYLIKEFSDPYSEEMKMRIGGIQPKQSTRMGAAIRHAISKFRSIESDQRILILLSDGFPQDHDYGEDRRSKEYALHDTMMALIEARKEGIRPFCITVDQAGNDYLRKMCEPESYLVIQDIYSLPERLPRIVEALMA